MGEVGEGAGGLGSSTLSFGSPLRASNWEGHSHVSYFWGALQRAQCFHVHFSSASVSILMNDGAEIVNTGENRGSATPGDLFKGSQPRVRTHGLVFYLLASHSPPRKVPLFGAG